MTPFYDLALRLFTRTQRNQIQKGIEKYPNTFNPREWSPQELLNHALEETVDLTHYLVGLKVLLDDRDEEIKQLKHEIELLKGEKSHKPFQFDVVEEINKHKLNATSKLRCFSSKKAEELNKKLTLDGMIKKPSYMDLDDE